MSSPSIKIRIDNDGNTHVDVAGVSGASCEDLTRILLQSLGEVEETIYNEAHTQEMPDYINTHESDE